MASATTSLAALFEGRRLTAGSQQLLQEAVAEARRRGHSQVSSEHMLLALMTSAALRGSHSFNWLKHMVGVEPEAVEALVATLPGIGLAPTAPHTHPNADADAAAAAEPFPSQSVIRIAGEAKRVHDIVATTDLCTEHIVAGMLLATRSAARYVLEEVSDGAVNCQMFLEALNIDQRQFRRTPGPAASAARPWCTVVVRPAAAQQPAPAGPAEAPPPYSHSHGQAAAATPPAYGSGGGGGGAAGATVPELVQAEFGQMRGPTAESNWLVKGRVITGRYPQSDAEVRAILAAGVDTFVCFTEWEPDYLRFDLAGAGGARHAHREISYIHFPIDDFSITDAPSTVAMVEELVRLVGAGRRLYLHCWSGRGRTGTVAVPLLMGLYPAHGLDELKQLCNRYKKAGRTGSTRGGHMPEVPEQHAQIQQNQHAYTRTAGHQHHRRAAAPTAAPSLAGRWRIRNEATGELLYCGSSLLDATQRRALTWHGDPNQDPAMVWELAPVSAAAVAAAAGEGTGAAGGGVYTVRNNAVNELLHAGPRMLDPARRLALTQLDAGSGGSAGSRRSATAPAPAGAEWELAPAGGGGHRRFLIRNTAHDELLYTGSKMLDAHRRHALTWVGAPNQDPAMVWVLEEPPA